MKEKNKPELWEIAFPVKTKLDRKLKALRVMRVNNDQLRHMPLGYFALETDVIISGKRENSKVVIRVSTSPNRFVNGDRDYVDIEIPRGIAEVASIRCGTARLGELNPQKTGETK